jgi:type I restriction enzyme, S subunit
MKRYSSYKDSGVEWIGEIPKGWLVRRNKFFTLPRKEKSVDGSEELLSVSEHNGVIPRRNIRVEEEHLTRSESLEGYLIVKNGDLVSNIMLMWKRGLGVSDYEGIVSPAYSVFSFIEGNPKYFHYLFRTDQYVSEFRRNSTGVIDSRLRLYDDSFGRLYSHFPPLSEQQQIVSYLDEQTSHIDTLIQSKQKKITLLKEKRTSLINQIVTKGLNPNVEMKDSGVEWIGEIPRGWIITRVKLISEIKRGSSPRPIDDPIYFDDEGEYGWVRITDVSKGGKFLTETTQRLSETGKSKSLPIDEDTLCMSISGSVGKVFITKIKCCIHDGFVCFSNLKVDKEYLYSLLTNDELYSEDRKLGTQYNINSDIVGNKKIPLPPLSEQMEIVEYLDKETELIDKTVSIEERKIELLKEYKQSLISEVITGKRKVVSDD